MAILTKNRLITVAVTLVVIALVWRNDTARGYVTGDTGFLGIF